MVKTICSFALALASLVPGAAQNKAVKPPIAEGDTVIVKLLPHISERADGNYIVDGDENASAQSRYNELKKELDERFEHMFELKESLDKQTSEMNAKWEEYYALREKYNRELKKIIAAWITESNYSDDSVKPELHARYYSSEREARHIKERDGRVCPDCPRYPEK